jgi:hypothetical protein
MSKIEESLAHLCAHKAGLINQLALHRDLTIELEEINAAIDALEKLKKKYKTRRAVVPELQPKPKPEPQLKPELKPTPEAEIPFELATEPMPEVLKIDLKEEDKTSLTNAIRAVCEEAKYTQHELSRVVMPLVPGTSLASVNTTVWRLLKDARLHKASDGIIRNVVDGKIQNLPPPTKEEDFFGKKQVQFPLDGE